MADIIDYYYAPVSGYAYLGEPRLMEIAARYGAEVRFKPVDIARVFAESGTTPPPKQPQTRFDYRLLDLQRTADYLNMPINPKPRHWPVPVDLAARAIYAAMECGIAPHRISFAVMSAVYALEQDVSDPEVIESILAQLDIATDELRDCMQSESVAQAFEQATQEAISLGVFGSPTYILNQTEMFFGQDRLFLLEHYLARQTSPV